MKLARVDRLNIGYQVRKNWYPPTAGSTVHVHQLATQLTARGHRLHTLVADCTAPGVSCYRMGQLREFLRSIDVLYIRIFGAWQLGKFSLLKLMRWARLPVIWEVNAPLEEHLFTGYTSRQLRQMYREIRILAKFVDAAICVTDPLAEYVHQKWGVRNCKVIASGSDPEVFSPTLRNEQVYEQWPNRYKIIWAGSPQYVWQGAGFLVDLARRLHQLDSTICLMIVGKPDPFFALGELPENMVFLGKRPYHEMPRLIASADLGICPCLDDDIGIGFYRAPLKLFDYLASGLPTLASLNTQTSKIIQPDVNGLLFENRIESAVDAIMKVRRDALLAHRLGEHARATVVDYFNWQRTALETESVILGVLGLSPV